MKIQSKSNPQVFYEVTSQKCSCPDFIYRREALGTKCKHQRELEL
jgi:predicted nucleic acid-binding Zn finger protein